MDTKHNGKKTHSTVGVYPTMADAEAAVRMLSKAKFPVDQISILTTNLSHEKDVVGFVTKGDVVKEGAAAGAWFGGLFGLLAGTAFIWVPGVGPLYVAGSLAALLLSTLEGTVAGAALTGLLSGLVSWGVDKQHIIKYADDLSGGKFLVIAHGTPEEVKKAHEILENSNQVELHLHNDEPCPYIVH
jgi:hypothetical protein